MSEYTRAAARLCEFCNTRIAMPLHAAAAAAAADDDVRHEITR